MTAEEKQLIDALVARIRNTPATDRDDEADRYLHTSLDTVPDALYVLAQTVIVQQYGLNNAQAQLQAARQQIDSLEGQLGQGQPAPQKQGSFLSHLFGGGQQSAPPEQPQYQPVNTGYAPPPPGYAPPAPGYAASYPPPVYGQPVAYQTGGGGFLRNALQTAAGVAAGEMMFSGVESLFHGFGGGGYGGGFGEARPTEVINNNYYDDSGPGDRGDDSRDHDDDRGGDDASYDNSGDFGGDDSSYDDGSGGDDGSGSF